MSFLKAWLPIFRIGLVQACLGGMFVLCTSLLNRVMTVELALAASVPGVLLGIHHVVQLTRPRWGYGADKSQRRTPWIVGGMALLALGVFVAAASTPLTVTHPGLGLTVAVLGYLVIGVGVGAAGTNLLALLATGIEPTRRAAAASVVWIMMIVGFIVSSIAVAVTLKPFTFERLLWVVGVIVTIEFVVSALAILGVEDTLMRADQTPDEKHEKESFRAVFAALWADPVARSFTLFVFGSMLAFGMQDLILEPFSAKVFNFPAAESTGLTGFQSAGAFFGMVTAGLLAGRVRDRFGSIQAWTVMGCFVSGILLVAIAFGGAFPWWPLRINVALLGFATGAFAIAAIGWMMSLVGSEREGSKMGLFGAAQAVGQALGTFVGASFVDIAGLVFDGQPAAAYGTVFVLEGFIFIGAGLYAARMAGLTGVVHPGSQAMTFAATAGGGRQ